MVIVQHLDPIDSLKKRDHHTYYFEKKKRIGHLRSPKKEREDRGEKQEGNEAIQQLEEREREREGGGAFEASLMLKRVGECTNPNTKRKGRKERGSALMLRLVGTTILGKGKKKKEREGGEEDRELGPEEGRREDKRGGDEG